MARRKEATTSVYLPDGTRMFIKVMDGLLPEDLIVQGAKAEGYRIITGKDKFPVIDKKTKDYLVRLDILPE